MPKFSSPALPAAKPMKNPPHMGRFIRTEILEPLGLSVSEAADILGVGRPALSNLLNGHAGLSAEMALRIEKAFGPRMEHLSCACSWPTTWRRCVRVPTRSRSSATRHKVFDATH
jgi:antitoxin HigA-1